MSDSHTTTTTTNTAAAGWAETASDSRRFIEPHIGRWPAHWRVPTAADLEALEASYWRGLVPAHVPLLHEPMPPLRVGSADAEEVAQRLYEAARREAHAGQGHMVGLAAPQVGIPARAFLFDPRQDPTGDKRPVEQLRCVINPTVEAVGYDLIREVEDCLSIPPIKGWVQRAARVRLRGYTPAGEPIAEEHTGLAARVIQHEADHVDGILFPQRVADDYDLLWASVEQVEQFTVYARAHRRGEKPPWNTRTPRDQWDAIRAGLAAFGFLTDPADEEAGR
jgi:peptide deformylase